MLSALNYALLFCGRLRTHSRFLQSGSRRHGLLGPANRVLCASRPLGPPGDLALATSCSRCVCVLCFRSFFPRHKTMLDFPKVLSWKRFSRGSAFGFVFRGFRRSRYCSCPQRVHQRRATRRKTNDVATGKFCAISLEEHPPGGLSLPLAVVCRNTTLKQMRRRSGRIVVCRNTALTRTRPRSGRIGV